MLPYLELQLGYLAVATAVAAIVWRLSRGRRPRGRALLGRYSAAVVAIALFGLASQLLMAGPLGIDRSARFANVALVLYGGAIAVPGLALCEMALARRAHGPVALLSLASLALAGWSLFVEPQLLGVRTERVAIESWPAGAPPLRVAHLSDLQTVGWGRREERALAMVRALEPDLIVFTGDYVAGPFGEPGPAVEAARRFLGALEAPLGVVVLDGHSEPWALRQQIFDGLDLTYLADESVELELSHGRALRLLGIGVHVEGTRPFDDAWIPRDRPPGTAVVAASHEPDLSEDLVGLGVDLHLAGHTHGGQVVVPGFGAPITLSRLDRRFARGLHRLGDHWINVCAGVGMEGNHAPRLRLFCPPEICLVVLEGSGPEVRLGRAAAE